MAKTLDDWLDDYHDSSTKSSEIMRSLALGAIAVIWVFKVDDNTKGIIPPRLVLPLFLIVIALVFDLLQYLIKTLGTYILHERIDADLEKHRIANTTSQYDPNDIRYPRFWEWASIVCFILKIALTIIGYVLIGFFIFGKLWGGDIDSKQKRTSAVNVKITDSGKASTTLKSDSLNIIVNVTSTTSNPRTVKTSHYSKTRKCDCKKDSLIKSDTIVKQNLK